jgi:hypothetical protein
MTIEEIRIEYNARTCYVFYGLTLKYFYEVLKTLLNDPHVNYIKVKRRIDGTWFE